ncbi:NAD(P)H-hydrate dehydratase [Arenibacterium sp. LLYu02]|uniref:NAD(P)H-hydrate dehydratase n=1 Tax=Arenibacterium sp. LLYu02 TaxID=3404132 RepID=UPI003B223478
MTDLLTSAQMRAVEKAAIEAGEVTGLALMERAGEGVVQAIFETWPALGHTDSDFGAAKGAPFEYLEKDEGPRRAVVLCGPGNNGGDGFVVARLLRQRGWVVEVYLYGAAERLPSDARVNYERWCEIGVVAPYEEFALREIGTCDVVLDALFGTGLTRALPDLSDVFQAMADRVRDRERPVIVAVDIPSGICADSGRSFPCDPSGNGALAVTADLTVTFHAKKLGHVLADGPQYAGRVVIKDIGLSQTSEGKGRSRQALVDLHGDPQIEAFLCREVEASSKSLRKGTDRHKFSHGHALILSGGAGRTGAARLAARGALRIGAGLVTLGVPPAAQMEVAAQITALMLARVEGPEGLDAVLGDPRISALCLGPGLGQPRARELVPVALASGRAVVLDADALSAFEQAPEELFAQLHKCCVLTPHGGEFQRLFPDLAQQLAEPAPRGLAISKVEATRAAARRAGCTVLFKGADTVIADETGTCSVHAALGARAAPWLATAGAGDVLAGFITGLLARGFPPQEAASTAAWLHVDCARHFGPGLIAEDLPEELPAVLRALGA